MGRTIRKLRMFRKGRAALAALAVLSAWGCATAPRGGRGVGDAAVLAEFWAAAGAEADPGEVEWVLGGGGMPAMRRMAAKRGLALAELRADGEEIRSALARGVPLLASLPPGRGGGKWRMAMPVRWVEGETPRVEFWTGGTGMEARAAGEFVEEQNRYARRVLAAFRPGRKVPEGREWQLAAGAAWMSAGRWKRAEACYRRAAEGDVPGDPRGTAGLGDALFRRGEYGAADEAYGRALEFAPGHPRVLNNRAYALLAADGNPELAVDWAERACAARPGNPRYLETAASAALAAGRPEDAALRLERAWELARNETPEARRAIMEQLARAWLAAGRESLAWQAWQARSREFPDDPPPRDLLEAWPFLKKRGGKPERLER